LTPTAECDSSRNSLRNWKDSRQ